MLSDAQGLPKGFSGKCTNVKKFPKCLKHAAYNHFNGFIAPHDALFQYKLNMSCEMLQKSSRNLLVLTVHKPVISKACSILVVRTLMKSHPS